MSKAVIEIRSRSRVKRNLNVPDTWQVINLGIENARTIGFKEIVFIQHKMQIRRAGIDDNNYKKITNSCFSIPIDYNLLGEYELVKIHDESFQLVKIEENGTETEPS